MTRREWLAALLITVAAAAAAFFLLRDAGDDPAPRSDDEAPSARVMSAAAADELLGRLTRRGWHCFDSLRAPVVKRCFLDQIVGSGTVSADVALTYADDYLTRVNVYAAGERDDGRYVEIAEQTARIVGDVLLDGAGATLVEQVGSRREIEVAGRRVFGNRAPGSSVQLIVESASYDDRGPPPPDLPPEAALVRAAEAGGLTCADDGSSTTCSGAGSPSMTITMSKASGRIGSLSISASNYAVPDDPTVTNMVAGYLFETGIGGPRAGAWVNAHAGNPTPVRADLGGVQLRLTGGRDRAVYLTVSKIVN